MKYTYWDEDGNWIEQAYEVRAKKQKKQNREFVKRLEAFVAKNDLFGTVYQYGLAIRREDVGKMEEKLNKLGVKYSLDFTPIWHVKILISNSQI